MTRNIAGVRPPTHALNHMANSSSARQNLMVVEVMEQLEADPKAHAFQRYGNWHGLKNIKVAIVTGNTTYNGSQMA